METKEIEKQENINEMAGKEMFKIWLNYDLNIGSDVDGLFKFLDTVKAIECGSELAYFEMPAIKNFSNHLKSEILANANLQKHDRIYIIVNYKDKTTSGFLFGGRKRANWIGYSVEETPDITDIL